jgi:hypothetical protein
VATILHGLKRSALIYAPIVGVAIVAGTAWGLLSSNVEVAWAIGALLWIAAVAIVVGATVTHSKPHRFYTTLTIEERRRGFSTQMWLYVVAIALAITAFVIQRL